MKTFALAMTAAAATAITAQDAISFTEGLVEAAIGKEVPDVTTCLTDVNTLASNVEAAFHDFEQETFSGVRDGIEMMGTIAESISNDLQNCEAVEPEFEQLIAMAEKFKSPLSFAFHVGKDLLVNGTDIYHDIEGAVTAYQGGDYETFGSDVGDALHAVFIGDSSVEIAQPWHLIEAKEASKVCVKNEGGFVVTWHMHGSHMESEDSEHFPIGQTKCMDIAEALPGIQDGVHVKVAVHATWGKTVKAEHEVIYKADSPITTTFKAHGTTLHFKVEDMDEDFLLNQYERFAKHFSMAF